MKSTAPRAVVHVADSTLATRLEASIAKALAAANEATAALLARTTEAPVVRLRTRRRLATLGAEAVRGALVVVRVTARGARRVPALVEELRGAGAAGVQLVWDGADPTPAIAEAHVFAALERARATPNEAPVVVSRREAPTTALRVLVAKRKERSG